MKLRGPLLAAIMIIFNIMMASGQGYEWEWSPRSPRTMPTRFVGVEASMTYAQHSGSLTYYEDIIPCCEFSSGTSLPLAFSIYGEQWVAPKTAVRLSLGAVFQTATFTVRPDLVPSTTHGEIQYEYQFDATFSQIALAVGARQRLISFLSLGLDVKGLFAVNNTSTLTDRVISPDDYFFSTNPPSKEKELVGVTVTDLAAFVLEPVLSLQYDFALSTGLVLSPSVHVSMPLTSLSTDQSWRYLGLGAGLRLSRGL